MSALRADFTYEETSRITGGAMAGMLKMASMFSKEAGQPIQTSVYVQGNRMARISARRGEIVDLDKETITTIDFIKKTYSTMTFAQMREMLEKQMAKAKEQTAGEKSSLEVKASLRETGEQKEVAGLPTKGMLMNLVMEMTDDKGQKGNFVVTSDVYLASKVAGYGEVRDFQRRMGEKMAYAMAGALGGGGMMASPQGAQMAKGYAALYKEAAKMDGLPAQMITRMGASSTGDPIPVAPEDTTPAPNVKREAGKAAGNTATDAAAGAVLGRLGGLGGGLGGFGRKKKEQPSTPPPDAAPATASGAAPASGGALIQMETTLTSFSSAPVDNSRFEVPSGFKLVEPDARRGSR